LHLLDAPDDTKRSMYCSSIAPRRALIAREIGIVR